MKRRVDIRSIKVQWLNARCLNIMAKYAQMAFYVDETRIKLSSDSCLVDVVEHAKHTSNHSLKAIYKELKQELKNVISSEDLQPKIDALLDYSRSDEISKRQP